MKINRGPYVKNSIRPSSVALPVTSNAQKVSASDVINVPIVETNCPDQTTMNLLNPVFQRALRTEAPPANR